MCICTHLPEPVLRRQGTLTAESFYSVNENVNTYNIAADKYGDIWTATYKKAAGCTGNIFAIPLHQEAEVLIRVITISRLRKLCVCHRLTPVFSSGP
jgi:hypothetical protein